VDFDLNSFYLFFPSSNSCSTFSLFTDWPDYESESDTSQVEAIINQSSPATPSDESLTMDTSIESANEHQPSSTRFVDMSQDFIEGGER